VSNRMIGLAVGAISVALVCGGGCGGSESEDGPAAAGMPVTVTKATFIAKADAVCRASKERIAREGVAVFRLAKSAGESRHDLETAAVRSTLIPTLAAEIRQIREIGVPSGDRARIRTILVAIEKALEEARSDPLSYVQAGGHYRPGSYHYGTATKLAGEYGLTGCPLG
jgi:hypothetical protein